MSNKTAALPTTLSACIATALLTNKTAIRSHWPWTWTCSQQTTRTRTNPPSKIRLSTRSMTLFFTAPVAPRRTKSLACNLWRSTSTWPELSRWNFFIQSPFSFLLLIFWGFLLTNLFRQHLAGFSLLEFFSVRLPCLANFIPRSSWRYCRGIFASPFARSWESGRGAHPTSHCPCARDPHPSVYGSRSRPIIKNHRCRWCPIGYWTGSVCLFQTRFGEAKKAKEERRKWRRSHRGRRRQRRGLYLEYSQ